MKTNVAWGMIGVVGLVLIAFGVILGLYLIKSVLCTILSSRCRLVGWTEAHHLAGSQKSRSHRRILGWLSKLRE